MPRGIIRNPCEGSGSPPNEITFTPKIQFTGYGKCASCGFECALTRKGNLMIHRDRRINV